MIDGPRLEPVGTGADALIILLHGYGSHGGDLIALAPMVQSVLPGAAIVAPNAPMPCPGVPGGYQWWPIQSFSVEERKNGVVAAAPALDAFITQELAKHGLSEDRLLLVGFSQGTMMALHVGVRRHRQLAGIIGFSGMLIAPDLLAPESPHPAADLVDPRRRRSRGPFQLAARSEAHPRGAWLHG